MQNKKNYIVIRKFLKIQKKRFSVLHGYKMYDTDHLRDII